MELLHLAPPRFIQSALTAVGVRVLFLLLKTGLEPGGKKIINKKGKTLILQIFCCSCGRPGFMALPGVPVHPEVPAVGRWGMPRAPKNTPHLCL